MFPFPEASAALVLPAASPRVEGRRYHRLEQASSATYHSRWGSHHVEEPLYREVGVHNGPTIKPIELRVVVIEHIAPDMARIVGELSADRSSRGVERTLRATGLVPPSRAFLAKRTTEIGIEIAALDPTEPPGTSPSNQSRFDFGPQLAPRSEIVKRVSSYEQRRGNSRKRRGDT